MHCFGKLNAEKKNPIKLIIKTSSSEIWVAIKRFVSARGKKGRKERNSGRQYISNKKAKKEEKKKEKKEMKENQNENKNGKLAK